MRELGSAEIMKVSGGNNIDPMDVAVGYSTTVIGTAVGFTIAGPIGSVVGAFAGFMVGTVVNVGYSLATGGSERMFLDDGESCRIIKWQ